MSTRQRILDYLERHPGSSAGEISRFLDMTPANIRYHLNLLVKVGRVQVSGSRQSGGAGRPTLLFSLTSERLGENLQRLLEAVLEDIEGDKNNHPRLEKIASRFTKGIFQDQNPGIARYNQALELLNQHSYHASWEVHPAGPRIFLRHCPYRDLPLTHPLICRLDEIILSQLFGEDISLESRRNFGTDPYSPCQFISSRPEPE